jgi:hypothetical protein
MTDTLDDKRAFLVSFNKADRVWATWIAWVLEEAGYSVWFQDWDFRGNFVEHMNRAHTQAHRTLAVLSDHYFGSDFTLAEWSARFAQDPAAREDRLVPVKVGPLTGEIILGPLIHADLTGCDEAEAQQRLLERVKKAVDAIYRAKPEVRPGFPGGPERSVQERPLFPRLISDEAAEAIIEAIKPFPGTPFAVKSDPASESDFVNRLIVILQRGGWKWLSYSASLMSLPYGDTPFPTANLSKVQLRVNRSRLADFKGPADALISALTQALRMSVGAVYDPPELPRACSPNAIQVEIYRKP